MKNQTSGFDDKYDEYKSQCLDRGEIPYCYEAWMDNIIMPPVNELAETLNEIIEGKNK